MKEGEKKNPVAGDLPVFVKWMDYLKWLLIITEKFPKKNRFTFSDRINTMALDMVDDLVEARYSKNKIPALQRINLRIEKIRILMRICYEVRILPNDAFKHSAYSLNEVGKMVGAWNKQQTSAQQ